MKLKRVIFVLSDGWIVLCIHNDWLASFSILSYIIYLSLSTKRLFKWTAHKLHPLGALLSFFFVLCLLRTSPGLFSSLLLLDLKTTTFFSAFLCFSVFDTFLSFTWLEKIKMKNKTPNATNLVWLFWWDNLILENTPNTIELLASQFIQNAHHLSVFQLIAT